MSVSVYIEAKGGGAEGGGNNLQNVACPIREEICNS